ncbi:hypothetical protein BDZ89DRAFT_632751 [Hymenopellis radicata]|nr:hypothetical protein BDZ89DRAFT_632751 [Hymenopellis radicata]
MPMAAMEHTLQYMTLQTTGLAAHPSPASSSFCTFVITIQWLFDGRQHLHRARENVPIVDP